MPRFSRGIFPAIHAPFKPCNLKVQATQALCVVNPPSCRGADVVAACWFPCCGGSSTNRARGGDKERTNEHRECSHRSAIVSNRMLLRVKMITRQSFMITVAEQQMKPSHGFRPSQPKSLDLRKRQRTTPCAAKHAIYPSGQQRRVQLIVAF